MEGLTLTVEDEPTMERPSTEQLREVVDRMTPDGGPSFVVLEGRGDDYAQAAGGDGVFTVEWREHRGEKFRHWKAGLPGRPTAGEVAIPTTGYEVHVRPNEQLSASDVVAILGAFLTGAGRPPQYVWRDMSDMFS